jgi:hypothetical protein
MRGAAGPWFFCVCGSLWLLGLYRPDRRFPPSKNGLSPQKKVAKPQNVRSASQKKIDAVERFFVKRNRPFCRLHQKKINKKSVHWHISQDRAV